MGADRSQWKPLSDGMQRALEEYDCWSRLHLAASDQKNRIVAPLYHYTDGSGLKGIIENEVIWFTSYTHLNDPGEITYGMSVTTEVLKEIGEGSDRRIKLFCDMVIDLFTHDNMRSAFGFFIASFSRDGDDLGQWRGYGDNGRGYSLGLAPNLFQPTEGLKDDPTENFVILPVAYGKQEGRALLMPAIEKALRVVGEIILQEAETMQDSNVGMPFFDAAAKALIASELVLCSMMIKHEAYRNEKEVRLALVGQHNNLEQHILTRVRGSEVIPFIKVRLPIRAEGNIAEIVLGPSAAPNAEDGARSLLPSQQVSVRRSVIPYRAN